MLEWLHKIGLQDCLLFFSLVHTFSKLSFRWKMWLCIIFLVSKTDCDHRLSCFIYLVVASNVIWLDCVDHRNHCLCGCWFLRLETIYCLYSKWWVIKVYILKIDTALSVLYVRIYVCILLMFSRNMFVCKCGGGVFRECSLLVFRGEIVFGFFLWFKTVPPLSTIPSIYALD